MKLDVFLHFFLCFPRHGAMSGTFSSRSADHLLNHRTVLFVSIPGSGSLVTRYRLSFALWLLGGLVLGDANVFAMPSPIEVGHARLTVGATSGLTKLAQTQPAQAPAPAAAPSPAPAAADEPIGNVATLTGSATAIRNKDSIALKLRDDIFPNDVLQTSAKSTLGVTFNDATTFNLTRAETKAAKGKALGISTRGHPSRRAQTRAPQDEGPRPSW